MDEEDLYDCDDESDYDLQDLYQSFYSLDESFDATRHTAEEETHGIQDVHENNAASSTPLYDGACLSAMQARLLIYQFVIRHSLSNKVFTELLQLLSVLLPRETNLPRTTYRFKKFLVEQFPGAHTVSHHYCTVCQSPLATSDSACDCPGSKVGQFITVPIGPQIRRMMEGMYTKQRLDLERTKAA